MIYVKLVGLTLLHVGPVLYFPKWQLGKDGDVFDTANIEVPPLSERISHKLRDLPLSEDFDDLIGAVPVLLRVRLG